MFVTLQGVLALRQLRLELQEDAGDEFPDVMLTELLVLHDVCKCLDLNIFQAKEVLGVSGWRCVAEYVNGSSCDSVNFEQAKQVLQASAG